MTAIGRDTATSGDAGRRGRYHAAPLGMAERMQIQDNQRPLEDGIHTDLAGRTT